jgi:hypothetical protein
VKAFECRRVKKTSAMPPTCCGWGGCPSNAPTKQLAVVGGTGRYRNVSGEATLVELGGTKARSR